MIGSTIYNGTKKMQDLQTNEIIEVDFVERTTSCSRSGFEIMYLTYLASVFDKLGGKKYSILKYLLENRDTHNQIYATRRKLAENVGVCEKTVRNTLNLLEESKLIKTKTNYIMVNPKLIHRGSSRKEIYLLQKFKRMQ